MKLLLLYEEVYSYSYAVISKLESQYGYEIHLVHWGVNESAVTHKNMYKPSYKIYLKGKRFFRLLNLARRIDPDVVVVPGWNDKSYLAIALWARKNNKPVVCTMDSQFKPTFKQRLAIFFRFSFFRKFFYSYIWIPGYPQLYTACKLGFKSDEVIYDLLSADTEVFSSPAFSSISPQCEHKDCVNFLFVGRLEEEKGVATLIDAWKKFRKNNKNNSLIIVGTGSLVDDIKELEGVSYRGYLNPYDVSSLMRNTDCFILPSYSEPWALVIHEAALSGLPVICTKKCGASTFFVIDKYNGFLINERDSKSLVLAMESYVGLSLEERCRYSRRSASLGKRISSSTAAAQFNSFF